jgi:hypothetical protein
MLTRIHVNRQIIAQNRKASKSHRKPALTAKNYKENLKGNTVEILDEKGRVIAQVVYRPDKPLNCGAVAWIETKHEIRVK